MKEFKDVVVKKQGYKRIVNNYQKFGWNIDNIVEETILKATEKYIGRIDNNQLNINKNVNQSKKILMHIYMSRDKNKYSNIDQIYTIENVFNLLCFIRKIFDLIIPIFTVFIVLILLLNGVKGFIIIEKGKFGFGGYWIVSLIVWIGLVLIENKLASLSQKILGIV